MMKTILRNSDHVAFYVGEHLDLTAEGLRGPDWIDPALTTETASVHDLTLPVGFLPGAYAYDGEWSVANQEIVDSHNALVIAQLALDAAALVLQIDGDVDAIYASAVGNRATEYQKAEEQARAFRATGYEGNVPKAVASWANATGNSARWAADDIITTADAWHTAEDTIRDVRLMCKQRARNAQTEEALEMVRIQWTAFLAQIRAQLG